MTVDAHPQMKLYYVPSKAQGHTQQKKQKEFKSQKKGGILQSVVFQAGHDHRTLETFTVIANSTRLAKGYIHQNSVQMGNGSRGLVSS